MSVLDYQSLCIDVGRGMTKCGFSGDDAPRAVFPSIVGREAKPRNFVGMDTKDIFVGDECAAKMDMMIVNRPIPINRHQSIQFSDLERILHHTFYGELVVTPEEHPTLLIAPTEHMSVKEMKKICSIMFETFNVPAFYMLDQTVASVLVSGRTTGQVLSIGDGTTSTVSIIDGIPINSTKYVLEDVHDKTRKRIAGELVDDLFYESLVRNGVFDPMKEFSVSKHREIAKEMKEMHMTCHVDKNRIKEIPDLQNRVDEFMNDRLQNLEPKNSDSESLKREKKNKNRWSDDRNKTIQFEVDLSRFDWRRTPDDLIDLKIGEERFDIPEMFFNPSLIGYYKVPGVHHMVKQSIEKCDESHHKELYQNIILAGGTTLIKYFPERFQLELSNIIPGKFKDILKIYAPPERAFSSWIGGSVLSSLGTFQKHWITFDDDGRGGKERGYHQDVMELINNPKKTRCPFATLMNREQEFSLVDCSMDMDMDERRMYVLEECFVEDEKDNNISFRICLRTCNFKIRFKSLLFL